MIVIALICLAAAWGFFAVLVFATGAVTVGLLRRLTGKHMPRAGVLILVAVTVSATATHLTMTGLLGGYEVAPGVYSASGFLRTLDWQPVLKLASLFATASLVPGFLWCVRPANDRQARSGAARDSSAALDTYFLVAPVALPAWWFVMAFLM